MFHRNLQLIRRGGMIIFVEDRDLIADSYKQRFEKSGETIVQIKSFDLAVWIGTSNIEELATIETVLLGECENSLNAVDTIRKKLNVPIVALLDNRSLEKLIGFFRRGVDDVVVKPVHPDELMVRIASIKRRSSPVAPETPAKQIVVFFDGRDPELAGELLLMPRRERRILEYLTSINGRRATKSQIFGAIYGVFDEKIEENVVESHISKLRKKLRVYLGFDPIDSRRYLGYRLDPKWVVVEKTRIGAYAA